MPSRQLIQTKAATLQQTIKTSHRLRQQDTPQSYAVFKCCEWLRIRSVGTIGQPGFRQNRFWASELTYPGLSGLSCICAPFSCANFATLSAANQFVASPFNRSSYPKMIALCFHFRLSELCCQRPRCHVHDWKPRNWGPVSHSWHSSQIINAADGQLFDIRKVFHIAGMPGFILLRNFIRPAGTCSKSDHGLLQITIRPSKSQICLAGY